MHKELIDRLLAKSQKGQIKIDFDLKKKVFLLSIPIFSSRTSLPESVSAYVEARKNSKFKPHTTSFTLGEKSVHLVQEIPFTLDFQATLRKETDAFLKMSKKCQRMLTEIAVEEKLSLKF